MANGVVFGWLTADEWYASAPAFLAGLEALQQRYVVEVRRSFHGWWCDPRSETRAVYREVETLCRSSPVRLRQPWQQVHGKDTEKGPLVWEVKWAPFWLQRDGQVLGPFWLICARNVRNPSEEKYFLANAAPGTPVEIILHVAFARWPMERTLADEKDELGLSHFEVRKDDAIMRQLSVTHVSHLFLARQTQRLRGEKSGDHPVPSSHRRQRFDRRPAAATSRPCATPRPCFPQTDARSAEERPGTPLPHADPLDPSRRTGHQPCRTPMLHTKIEAK